MIHLDTNWLIEITGEKSINSEKLLALLKKGEVLGCSALAWFEFACGPVDDNTKKIVRVVLGNNIIPLNESISELGAELFNFCGRKKGVYADCLIAATAIFHDAELATFNKKDFAVFQKKGLAFARM